MTISNTKTIRFVPLHSPQKMPNLPAAYTVHSTNTDNRNLTKMIGLKLENISMEFVLPSGELVQALSDISFEMAQGQMLAVLGPSGCGKTTLLNIIAGFLAPTNGTVILNEQRVFMPGAERGMVFQHGTLFEWKSVAENIAFGLLMRGQTADESRHVVDELLETMGLQGFGDKAVYELSGGMQQRVALARCLANDPDIILMDEPLGALDALTREKMQGLILRLWKETGKTIILITHSVEEALFLGERLFVMAPRPGRIEMDSYLPFADMGLNTNPRDIKSNAEFIEHREEVLAMIWEMEEEIMGRVELGAA